MLRDDPAYAAKAARVAALAKDVSEYLAGLDLAFAEADGARRRLSRRLLAAARPEDPRSAQGAAAPRRLRGAHAARGAYLLRLGGHLQHPAAGNGRRSCATRKVANLARVKPDVIAAGNIGCLAQIAAATATPVVHTVELLDWATGGPEPAGLG